MTERWDKASNMLNQTPMFCARSATGRRYSHTNLWASRRISTQLFRRAKSGARGNAATKIVMKPNWRTGGQEDSFTRNSFSLNWIQEEQVLSSHPFPDILQTGLHMVPACSLPPSAGARLTHCLPVRWQGFSSAARLLLYCIQAIIDFYICKIIMNTYFRSIHLSVRLDFRTKWSY